MLLAAREAGMGEQEVGWMGGLQAGCRVALGGAVATAAYATHSTLRVGHTAQPAYTALHTLLPFTSAPPVPITPCHRAV